MPFLLEDFAPNGTWNTGIIALFYDLRSKPAWPVESIFNAVPVADIRAQFPTLSTKDGDRPRI